MVNFIPLDLVRYLILCENTQPALPKLRILSMESLPTPEHKAALRDVYGSRRWSRYICGTDTAILLGDPDEATVAETHVFDSDETSECSEWSEWYVFFGFECSSSRAHLWQRFIQARFMSKRMQ